MKAVIYTAITNAKDALVEEGAFGQTPHFAFLDYQPDKTGWTVLPVCDLFIDPNRNAKIHKVLAHQYFDVDYSLWIDGNIVLYTPIDTLIEEHLGEADICVFTHYGRQNVWQEAAAIKKLNLDDPDIVDHQVELYKEQGLGEGLFECPVILRRHNEACEAFNNAWWSEICRHSRRDQLSFPYAVKQTGIKVSTFNDSLYGGKLVHKRRHLK